MSGIFIDSGRAGSSFYDIYRFDSAPTIKPRSIYTYREEEGGGKGRGINVRSLFPKRPDHGTFSGTNLSIETKIFVPCEATYRAQRVPGNLTKDY